MSIEIPLTQGFVAIVDDADADLVNAHKWSVHKRKDRLTIYARRNTYRPDGTRGSQGMHTFLTGYELTDHINGNGLDNRRVNLRAATNAENTSNAGMRTNNKSGFKGVDYVARNRKWRAQVSAAGKRRYLGLYATAEGAALAYDTAARDLYGEFATLNFPQHGERAA